MPEFKVPYPSKQIAFHQLLVAARATVLRDVVVRALMVARPEVVSKELNKCAPSAARKLLAGAGIRDEYVLATPEVLRLEPTALGYYRLLLGIPQKTFYTAETGLSRLQSMEKKGILSARIEGELPQLCQALNAQAAELVAQLSPEITRRDVFELPLLTLGVQFDGISRNNIGKAATEAVFASIRDLVKERIVAETATSLTLNNSSGRQVRIALASDPDVEITEQFPDGSEQVQVAIEIKGGTDRSNAHNRAGEAEKSHQKVRGKARDFWTIIAMKGVVKKQLSLESPTTRKWYDVAEVLGRAGPDWDRFTNDLMGAIGI